MVYFTQFVNEPEPVGEKGFSRSKVELQGYRTAKQQIESFLLAGERLKSAREGQFDIVSENTPDVDDVPLDPTRSKDFDLVDVADVNKYLADKALAEAENEKLKNDGGSANPVSEDTSKSARENEEENKADEA